jgi:hypothetical protein
LLSAAGRIHQPAGRVIEREQTMAIRIYPFWGGGGASGDLAAVATSGDYNDLKNKPTVITTAERARLALALVSDVTGIVGADAVTNIVSLTQAEYDAVPAPDASTLYVITD